jgi:hypothetical protein
MLLTMFEDTHESRQSGWWFAEPVQCDSLDLQHFLTPISGGLRMVNPGHPSDNGNSPMLHAICMSSPGFR